MIIKELIKSQHESLEPQSSIIRCLDKHNGKRLTKKHIDELRKFEPTIRLMKVMSTTTIEWGHPSSSNRLLIANKITNVVVETGDIVARNPQYFEALRERNEQRLESLKKPGTILCLEQAIKDYTKARETLTEMLKYGGVFSADRHQIRETYHLEDGVTG